MSTPELPDEADAPVRIRWFALLSLIGHLVLLATGAYSLSTIGGHGWVAIVIAVVFGVSYAGMWWVLLTPGSRHSLGLQERFMLKVVVIPIVVVIAALGQVWLVALVGASFVFLGDALDGRRGPSPLDPSTIHDRLRQ